MAESLVLKTFSKSAFGAAVSGNHVACNPVIDLAATVGDGEILYIWRTNGQIVSKHTERNQKVGPIKWKDDGQFVAAGWSDGVVRLTGLENSKAIHQVRVAEKGTSQIQFIAWSRNHVGRTGRSRPRRQESSDQLFPKNPRIDDKKFLLDLPRELTFLEVDTALPKISPLPVSGGFGDDMFVFSTRSSLEFIFRPFKAEDTDSVDVMIVGTTNGNIHLSIYDSFAIGTFKDFLRNAKIPSSDLRLCGHGSSPDISTHALLLKPAEEGKQTSIFLVPMDLTFVHSFPVNLSLLASKTTTLQNLLRYIKQTQSHMANEWKASKELPNRFLLSVEDDLKKLPKGPMTVVQALYHTVATGHVLPAIREWLVDSIAERGHKRWEKAVLEGLENLRALVHENFIPALDRCAIILSRLLGIARFHDSGASIGFTTPQIMQLLDIISCLNLVANRILLVIVDELESFTSFSSWLRFEIDTLASPSASDELTEREATMDYEAVLEYIEEYLTNDPLAIFFDEVSTEDFSKDPDHIEAGLSRLELLHRQLNKQEMGQPYMKALPNVDFLVNYLTRRATTLFAGIAEAERRSVRFGQTTELSVDSSIWKQEVRVCARASPDDQEMLTFTAIVAENDKRRIHLFRTSIKIINGISSAFSTSVCSVSLRTDIIDLKFLDDTALLLLCHDKEKSVPVITRVAYRSPVFSYTPLQEGEASTPPTATPEGSEEAKQRQGITTLELSHVSKFSPVQMEVCQACTARGEVPARICLLGSDKVTYKVYALPNLEESQWAEAQVALPVEDEPME